MSDYIRWLRRHVGRELVQLNFSAGCIVEDGRVLLQRRGDDNRWGFPGGAIELGESAEEALLREVEEETGLQVRVEALLGIYTKYRHVYPNGDVTQPLTTFFRCTLVGGILREDGAETVQLRYFSLPDVPPLMNSQHDDALADLRAGRNGVYR
jgi:mutator protein MutT